MPAAPRKAAQPADDQPDLTTLGLHDRVALIQAELVDVPKTGHADVKNAAGAHLYSYDYVREEDMMAALKPLLAKYRVACYVSMDEILVDGNMRTVRGSMTVACNSSIGDPEEFTIRASASGTDKGDKAIVKAQTSVTRYLLQKGWLIETGGVDPEQENVEHQADSAPAAARRRDPGVTETTNGPPVISAAQRRMLMAEINELEINLDAAREVIAVSAGVFSTKDIPKSVFSDLRADLKGYAANPEAGRVLITEWREAHPDLAEQLDAKIAVDSKPGDQEGDDSYA